jgi:predicted transcriptional regulator
MADADHSNLTSLTVDLLSAYVANNSVEHIALAELIKSTHAALKIIDSPEPPAPEAPEYKPAVSVRQSLKSDAHIISLIDGKPYQTLKRHLKGHGLTPDEYRTRYGLPKTYPIVAPAYSASRRAIAEKLGLGRRVKGAQAEAAPPVESKTAENPAPVTAKAKSVAAPKAPKTVPAKADVTPIAKAKVAAKAKAPAKPKAAPKPVEAPVLTAPAKAAPKARKGPAPKPNAAPAPAAKVAAKSAPRKRAAKTTA